MKEKIKTIFIVLIFLGLSLPLFSFAQTFDRDLYFGLRNDSDVAKLQELLTSEGLYSGPITGNFFSLTLEGLKRFQTREGISPVAGYFGPKTKARANEILASQIQASNQQAIEETGQTPSPSPTPQPSDAISSLQNQILILQQQITLLLQQLQFQQAASVVPIPSPTPLPSPTPSLSPSPTPTYTPQPTLSPSPTPIQTPSPTPTPTPSTPTPTPTPTPIPTPTPTPTPSPSPTPSISSTPTPTPSPTPTPMPDILSSPLGGNITTQNSKLTLANSPYIVTETIQILEGVVLEIEPGVELRFNEGASLAVNGTLVARGTPSKNITFTSDTEWDGIKFINAESAHLDENNEHNSGTVLEYAKIEKAKGSPAYDWSSAYQTVVIIKNSSPLIKNNIFSYNRTRLIGDSGYLLSFDNSSSLIIGNTIENNNGFRTVIRFSNSQSRVYENLISKNSGRAIDLLNSNVDIEKNTIENNQQGGIGINGNSSPIIKYNIIKNNSGTNGSAINIGHSSSPIIENNEIINNSVSNSGSMNYGIVQISSNAAPIIKNNLFSNNIGYTFTTDILVNENVRINYNNFINSNSYEVFLFNSPASLNLKYNYWGTTDTSIINSKIWDYYDDISLGKVDYQPIATSEIPDAGIQ